MKNILLVTYYFYPEKTPRAFRTFELAKEFGKQGYNVEVMIPDNSYEYGELEQLYNIKVTKIKGFYRDFQGKGYGKYKGNPVSNRFKYLVRYFIGEKEFLKALTYTKSLNNTKKKYDLLISVGLPLFVHIGVSLAIRKNKYLTKISVADFGDPFYMNSEIRFAPYFKYIEKFIADTFDYLSIPTEKMKESFTHLGSNEKIKIIPQGFNLEEIKLGEYQKNIIPTFGYAGIFYPNIRNPYKILEFLKAYNKPFKFVIYTNTDDNASLNCIIPFLEQLNDKIEIINLVPRIECIYELSKLDFIINIDNLNSKQTPSKIIDYALTKRPIFNTNQEEFDPYLFEDFLNGDYKKQLYIDVEKYDIRLVCQKFLSLKV